MSIVQGGPGFPVMLPAAYHYLTTHEYIGQVMKDSDVPDPFVLELLTKVRTYTMLQPADLLLSGW